MFNKIACIAMLTFFCTSICTAQNFSGLQNKKLNEVKDLSNSLESLLSRLMVGSIDGSIDSVVVLFDAEKELKVKIFYTGFEKGFFSVSTMGQFREQEPAVTTMKFSQATSGSPAECIVRLNGKKAGVPEFESPYLRIDISRRENHAGKIRIFELRKKWKTEIAPENVIMNVMLQPVGVAARLPNVQPQVDVMPAKKIIFYQEANFYKSPNNKRGGRPIKSTGGGNFYRPGIRYLPVGADNISGTWSNTDANTTGLTQIIIANKQIQVFYKCAPKDCELGKAAIADENANSLKVSFSSGRQKTELNLVLVNSEMQVKQTDMANAIFNTITKTRTYTFKKNIEVNYFHAQLLSLDQFATLMTFNTGQPDNKPRGPDKNFPLNLWNDMAVDNLVDFGRPQEISNINMNIFPDKNPRSGIYYILPADYHLRWKQPVLPKKPEYGYDFDITYGQQAGGGSTDTEAPVRMSAKLTAGISNNERAFVKAMLRSKFPDFVDIRYLELREDLQTTFQNTLSAQFGISPDKITVTTTTDLNNDITLSWRTNADTKEFIQTALTSREGISANVILKPKDEEIIDQNLPATINLADTRSLGKMSLEPVVWRTRSWRNTTPYPLLLKYLHVLKKQINGSGLIVYSWAMNNAEVPLQGQIAFDHSRVPTWLDNDPTAFMWLDYEVLDCKPCDDTVMKAVTGGVFGNTVQQIKLTIAPGLFDTLKASSFLIYIRSKQADPKGETMKELDGLKITNDHTKDFYAGPLFLPPGTSPDYEYKITVATNDDFYPSNQWIKSSSRDLSLGLRQVKEIFKGIIPGIN